MVQAPAFAAGTPTWVDLASPDVESAKSFYTQLFGWTAETVPAPEAGGYTFFKKDGRVVCAVGPAMDPNQPPAWTTYVSTADAEATAKAVEGAGGKVMVPPFDVMDQGRMAVFQDPTGAFFSVWQPIAMFGAELVNQPGSFGWNELATRDLQAAKTFYNRVFGWTEQTHGIGTGAYTEFQVEGRSIAGGMDMGQNFPPQVPPHWAVYFVVEDCDASLARVVELGGHQIRPAMDIEPGRFAVVTDPQGAAFSIIALKG
jgi:predicted enzyme related to lactoylglutathione lyase